MEKVYIKTYDISVVVLRVEQKEVETSLSSSILAGSS